MQTQEELEALGHSPVPVLTAIRAKCMDCSCYQRSEIENCTVTKCALYPFRFGRNPWRKTVELTEERRQRNAEILKQARKRRAKT